MVSHQEKMINTFKMINELPKFDRYVEVFGEDGAEDGWYVALFSELEKIEDNFDEWADSWDAELVRRHIEDGV